MSTQKAWVLFTSISFSFVKLVLRLPYDKLKVRWQFPDSLAGHAFRDRVHGAKLSHAPHASSCGRHLTGLTDVLCAEVCFADGLFPTSMPLRFRKPHHVFVEPLSCALQLASCPAASNFTCNLRLLPISHAVQNCFASSAASLGLLHSAYPGACKAMSSASSPILALEASNGVVVHMCRM